MPVSEADVAITQLLGSHAPFRAVLKQNLDDFVVQEVTPSATVVTPHKLPRLPPRAEKQRPPKRDQRRPPAPAKPVDAAAYHALDALLPAAASVVRALLGDDSCRTAALPPCKDKTVRKNVHHWIRQHVPHFESETDHTPDGQVIRLSVSTRGPPLKRKRADYVRLPDAHPAGDKQDGALQNGDAKMADEAPKAEQKTDHDPHTAAQPAQDAGSKPAQGSTPQPQPDAADGSKPAQPEPSSNADAEQENTNKAGTVKADEASVNPEKADAVAAAREAQPYRPLRPDRQTFVQFVLWKRGRDTFEVLNVLARCCRTKPQAFTVAGTKDKRGVTMQMVTVRGVSEAQLAWANKRDADHQRTRGRDPTMVVSDIAIARNGPLALGDLRGNRFTLVLRDVETDEANLRAAAQSVRERGFVNYFGLQRFGSGISATHETGFALMREDVEDVCRRLLLPVRAGEADGTMRAGRRAIVDALDGFADGKVRAVELANALPPWMTVERALANAFAEQERRGETKRLYADAFNQIPRNLRKLYGHAVQAYLWNTMASERIRQCRPDAPERMFAIEGDLVLVDETSDANLNSDTPVRAVTAEEAGNKSVSISRVVLPVIGAQVPVPESKAGRAAHAVLEREKCTVKSFSSRYLPDRMKGTYRKLMALPTDVEMKVVAYTQKKESLIPSFVDHLLAKERARPGAGERKADGTNEGVSASAQGTPDAVSGQAEGPPAAGAAASVADTTAPASKEGTQAGPNHKIQDVSAEKARDAGACAEQQAGEEKQVRQGVIFSFTLGTSSYATMLVRELTKKDSSVSNQKTMQQDVAAQ